MVTALAAKAGGPGFDSCMVAALDIYLQSKKVPSGFYYGGISGDIHAHHFCLLCFLRSLSDGFYSRRLVHLYIGLAIII